MQCPLTEENTLGNNYLDKKQNKINGMNISTMFYRWCKTYVYQGQITGPHAF